MKLVWTILLGISLFWSETGEGVVTGFVSFNTFMDHSDGRIPDDDEDDWDQITTSAGWHISDWDWDNADTILINLYVGNEWKRQIVADDQFGHEIWSGSFGGFSESPHEPHYPVEWEIIVLIDDDDYERDSRYRLLRHSDDTERGN